MSVFDLVIEREKRKKENKQPTNKYGLDPNQGRFVTDDEKTKWEKTKETGKKIINTGKQEGKGLAKGVLRSLGTAGIAVEELATGSETDIHNTMIALEKAEVSFQLMMQVRNKIVTAYETIMRTGV